MSTETLILERVRHLELLAKQKVLDLFFGAYRSAFKGVGVEVEDIREYAPGDDLRTMSWARTAMMGKPYVKTFREERDLTVLLLVDVSASLFSGSCCVKQKRLAEVAAVLAFSAMYNHDKVGLMLFSDQVEKYVPPRRGDRHGLRLIREFLEFSPSHRATDLCRALEFLHGVHKKRAIVFLLSDFLFQPDTQSLWEHPFQIAASRNDVIAIRIIDPLERKMLPLGLVDIQDPETNQLMTVDVNKRCIQQMKEDYEVRSSHFHSVVESSGGSFIDIMTDRSYDEALLSFFHKRKRALVR